jgi:hypothetical protein
MACNAWNHPSNCQCGWGGVFYGSGYKDGLDQSGHWQRSDSYTNPNSRCPRCNALVYFYRSEFGGSVYFDNLGPPWPKHPCMDLGSTSKPAVKGPSATSGRAMGWRPMICEDTRRHERCDEVVVLKVQSGAGGPKRLFAVFDRSLLDYRTPFLARAKNDRSYEVSTLNSLARVPGEVTFTAYSSLDGLPQPFRDLAKGVLQPIADVESSPLDTKSERVTVQKWQQKAEEKAPLFRKAPQPETPKPKRVQITIKHRRPQRASSKEPTPATLPLTPTLQKASLSQSSVLASPKAKRPSVTQPDRPLTSMELAFQKVAASDPVAEELLVTGFRGLGPGM